MSRGVVAVSLSRLLDTYTSSPVLYSLKSSEISDLEQFRRELSSGRELIVSEGQVTVETTAPPLHSLVEDETLDRVVLSLCNYLCGDE